MLSTELEGKASHVSILGMLEGVLKGFSGSDDGLYAGEVSILGMLEGVLKAPSPVRSQLRFTVSILGMLEGVLKVFPTIAKTFSAPVRFNPWYVGGGVKSPSDRPLDARPIPVSILGMLEGVLKAKNRTKRCNSLWEFQSLVCWRGC